MNVFEEGSKPPPVVSIIIVNYNGRELMQSCLESVFAQSFKDIEVIAVDNGSADGSAEHIRKNFPSVRVVPLPANTGFPGGNKEGLKHAGGRYVMLLNNDVEADRDCLEGLVSAMEKDASAGICAAKMLVYGKDIIDSAGDGFSHTLKGFKRGEGRPAGEYDKAEYVFGACAGAALYRREMLDQIGFLDEDFFLIFEDTDLNLRAQVTGWKVQYVPCAVVRHKVRSTIGNMSDTAIYYSLRNSELVRVKNIPFGLFAVCLPSFLAGTLLEFVYFGIKHRKIALYCRAKLDALRMLPGTLKKRKKILGMRKMTIKYLYGIMTPAFNKEFFYSKAGKFING